MERHSGFVSSAGIRRGGVDAGAKKRGNLRNQNVADPGGEAGRTRTVFMLCEPMAVQCCSLPSPSLSHTDN